MQRPLQALSDTWESNQQHTPKFKLSTVSVKTYAFTLVALLALTLLTSLLGLVDLD